MKVHLAVQEIDGLLAVCLGHELDINIQHVLALPAAVRFEKFEILVNSVMPARQRVAQDIRGLLWREVNRAGFAGGSNS